MPAELTAMRSGSRVFDVLNVVLELALKTPPTRALLQLMPPIRHYQDVYRKLFEQELAGWPADIRAALVGEAHQPRLAVGRPA